jgi:hypothetical protein
MGHDSYDWANMVKSGKRKQRENPACQTLKEKMYWAKQKEIL